MSRTVDVTKKYLTYRETNSTSGREVFSTMYQTFAGANKRLGFDVRRSSGVKGFYTVKKYNIPNGRRFEVDFRSTKIVIVEHNIKK